MRNERLRGIRWMGQMLTALFFLASSLPASAAKVMLEGTSYQVRRGQTENEDYVLPYPPEWGGGPYCFQMATNLTVRVVPGPGETITRWKLTGASLYSWPFNQTYWTVPESDWLTPAQTVTLPYLPLYVDVVTLEGDVVMDIQGQPPGGDGAQTDSFGRYSDLYIVLDTPKIPMAPAWAPVLTYSCFWAAGAESLAEAKEWLTEALWTYGEYEGGIHYVTDMTESGETFHLKDFLAANQCPLGECEDFADFLLCLNASVGVTGMKSQRSNPLGGEPYRFITNWLRPAKGVSTQASWVYHEFAAAGSTVWNGAVSVEGWGVPKGWDRDSTYRVRLIHHFVYITGTWLPTPSAGFTPVVTTNPL